VGWLLVESTLLGAWCLTIAVGLGYPLTSRLMPRHRSATRLSAAFLIGTAILSYLILGLGGVGLLRPVPLLALLTMATIPCVRARGPIAALLGVVAADARIDYFESPLPVRALTTLTLALVAMSLVVPLLPVTNADALAYATAAPERFARAGAIQFYSDSFESAFVLLVEQLHAIGYVFALRPVGVWFEVAAQVLLFFAAADCYRAVWGDQRRGSASLCGVALLVIPLTQMMPFMAKAHLVEALAVTVAMAVLLEAPEKGGWSGAAACAGVCVATKYSAGLGLASLIAPTALRVMWRSRHEIRGVDLVGAGASLVLLGAPLYIRNWWWTGNPLFPMSLPGFGSSYHLRHQDDWITSLFYPDYGFGRRPLDLLLWWVRVSVLPIRGSASYIGTFALSFLPLALVRRRAPSAFTLTLGIALSTSVLFLVGVQLERYYIAAIVAMSVLAVAGWDAHRGTSATVQWSGVALLFFLAIFVTLPQKAYGLFVQLPALVSHAREVDVIEQTTPWYADFVRIRGILPPRSPVLCLLRNCQYLVDYRREDDFFRLVEASEKPSREIDPRPVYQGLRARGIDFIVALDSGMKAGAPVSVVDWLRRCGGRIVYRNPQARFGTRDPRRVLTGAVVLIELNERLTPPATTLSGDCVMPSQAW